MKNFLKKLYWAFYDLCPTCGSDIKSTYNMDKKAVCHNGHVS